MTTVEVVFPKSGPPLVAEDFDAVCEDHVIAWHIKSENPEIASVEICFDGDEPFFPVRRKTLKQPAQHPSVPPQIATHTEREDFDYGQPPVSISGDQPTSRALKQWDTQVIWGRAPVLNETAPAQRVCKYTIFGYGRQGQTLYELDPNIVVSRPR